MRKYRLQIKNSETGEVLECPLSSSAPEATPEALARLNKSVLSDGFYEFVVLFDDPLDSDRLTSAAIGINSQKFECIQTGFEGGIRLHPIDPKGGFAENHAAFIDSFGFVALEVELANPFNEEPEHLFSELIQVVLPEKDPRTREIQAMASYVVKYSEEIFVKKTDSDDAALQKNRTLEEVLDELKEAVDLYRRFAVYFAQKARTRLVQKETKSSIDRLGRINFKTVERIARRPGELSPVDFESGISMGGVNYMPRHAPALINAESADVYENRVVKGLLVHLIKRVEAARGQVEEKLQDLESRGTTEGYVSSLEVALELSVNGLKSALGKISAVLTSLHGVYDAYSRIFPFDAADLTNLPRPTKFFLTEPVYRLFFEEAAKWLSKPPFAFEDEKVVYPLLMKSSLYEYYVLVRQIEMLKADGYVFTEGRRFIYPDSDRMKFADSTYANTFYFEKEGESAVLYWQPVIQRPGKSEDNGIALKRITTLGVDFKAGRGISTADYYTPDFILKTTNESGSRYTVIDAKYSTLEVVRRRYASEVAFKYILSVRSMKPEEKFDAVKLYYGKHSKDEIDDGLNYSFWNLAEDFSGFEGPAFTAVSMHP